MKSNINMKILKSLYVKELGGLKDSLVGHIVMIGLLYAVLLLGARRWDPQAVYGIAYLPFPIFPFWYLFTSHDLIKKEWKNRTFTLWKSIPVPSLYLLGAKLLALWTEFLLLGFLVITGFFLVVTIHPMIVLQDYTFINGIVLIFQLFIMMIPVTPIIFLVYVSGVSYYTWDFLIRITAGVCMIFFISAGTFLFGIPLAQSDLFFTINMPQSVILGESAITFAGGMLPVNFIISYYLAAFISFFAAARFLEERPHP